MKTTVNNKLAWTCAALRMENQQLQARNATLAVQLIELKAANKILRDENCKLRTENKDE